MIEFQRFDWRTVFAQKVKTTIAWETAVDLYWRTFIQPVIVEENGVRMVKTVCARCGWSFTSPCPHITAPVIIPPGENQIGYCVSCGLPVQFGHFLVIQNVPVIWEKYFPVQVHPDELWHRRPI